MKSLNKKFRTVIENNTFYFYKQDFEHRYKGYNN